MRRRVVAGRRPKATLKMRRAKSGRSPDEALTAAIYRLREEVGELIDLEKAVVRLELKYKTNEVLESTMRWGAAVALSLLGSLCVALATVFVLATVMPAWLAALLVGTALIAMGALMFRLPKRRRERVRRRAEEVEVRATPSMRRAESAR